MNESEKIPMVVWKFLVPSYFFPVKLTRMLGCTHLLVDFKTVIYIMWLFSLFSLPFLTFIATLGPVLIEVVDHDMVF